MPKISSGSHWVFRPARTEKRSPSFCEVENHEDELHVWVFGQFFARQGVCGDIVKRFFVGSNPCHPIHSADSPSGSSRSLNRLSEIDDASAYPAPAKAGSRVAAHAVKIACTSFHTDWENFVIFRLAWVTILPGW